jgi:hypothetical protein
MPSHFKIETENGYRYFETFRSRTSFEILSRNPDIESLRLILLQAGSSEPSIRYAIAALGALQKASEAGPKTLQYDDHWSKPNLHQQNALKMYSRAIAHMKKDASLENNNLRMTLLKCLVILCFEAWTGNQELALRQMQTGISLIQEWNINATNADRKSSISTSPVDEDIIRVFDRLVLQVLSVTIAKSRSPACPDSLKRDGREALFLMPSNFSSLKEAGFYQSIIMRYEMYLITSMSQQREGRKCFPFNCRGPKEEQDNLFDELDPVIADTKRWSAAFEGLSQTLYSRGGTVMVSAAILKLHLTTLYLCLVGLVRADEMVYDEYHREFEEILKLAEMVLRVEVLKSTGFCGFDVGVVISLQFTAQKCRSTVIRRKAIALMSENPRREGLLDSLFAARMMEWVADIEEEFMDNGHVPEWARIRGVQHQRYSPYLHLRTAILSCQQRTSEGSDELVARQTAICW